MVGVGGLGEEERPGEHPGEEVGLGATATDAPAAERKQRSVVE